LDKSATVSTTTINSSTLNPGESLTFVSGEVVQGTYGYLNLKSDGSYSYVLTADVPNNTLVNEYFTYEIADSSGCTDTAVLHIQIQGNQVSPPNAVADAVTVVENGVVAGTSPISSNVLANDTLGAVDTGPLNVISVWTSAATGSPTPVLTGTTSGTGTTLIGSYGTLSIGADGSYTYTLDNNNPLVDALPAMQSLTELFYYQVADSKATSEASVTTLTITIQGANDAPVAVDDTAVAFERGGFNNTVGGFDPVGNVLANDTDVDTGDILTVSKAQAGRTGASAARRKPRKASPKGCPT